MNDLFYVKYEAKRMLVDSLDMPKDVELAHRRLCDFIWAMDRCPLDDVEILMGVTRTSPADWARVRGGLELKGWESKNGFFSHKGACKTLLEAKEEYDGRCKQTKAARKALNEVRKSKQEVVTGPATETVTETVTGVQSESQSQSVQVRTPVQVPVPVSVHTPPPTPQKVCLSVQKEELHLKARFDWLEAELCRFYKRPRPNVNRGEEEHLVAEVSRRHDVKSEWLELQRYRSEVGEKYFPQSLKMLCQEWDKTLDKSRNHAPPAKPYKEPSIAEKALDAFNKRERMAT